MTDPVAGRRSTALPAAAGESTTRRDDPADREVAATRGGARARLRRPVLAADRPPDPRVRRLRRAAAARRSTSSRSASAGRRRSCSPAGPRRSTPRARRALRRELLELGIPVLGICYGMQAMVLELGGRVEGAEAGEFGRTELTLVGDGGAPARRPPAEQQCWMSHRDCVFEAPAGLHRARRQPRLAGRRAREHRAGPLRDPVPPRGRPHALRHRRSSSASCARSPAAKERWSPASVIDEQVAADPRPGRRRRRHLRPLRRRRLGDRGGARPPRDRRPAHLRPRRPRADAQERGASRSSRRSASSSASS